MYAPGQQAPSGPSRTASQAGFARSGGSVPAFAPVPSGSSERTPQVTTPLTGSGHAPAAEPTRRRDSRPPKSTTGEAVAPAPLSVTKVFKQYFTKEEVKRMVAAQTSKVQPARVTATREQACIFMDRVGVRLGFPRRTIACAQLLYHRFHLYFPIQDFSPYDVSLSCFLIASKLEDTLKKLREIQSAGFQVRNGSSTEPDPSLLEPDRSKLVGIERLILETMCFDFGSGRPVNGKDAFGYVVAIGRQMGAGKPYVKLAFRIAVDSYRTLAGLTYPPHIIALAALFLASFFDPEHPNSNKDPELVASGPSTVKPDLSAGWERQYEAEIEEVEDIALLVLDLYEYAMKQVPPDLVAASARALPSSAFPPASPADPTAPAVDPHLGSGPVVLPQSVTDVSKIQIRLREEGAKSRARSAEGLVGAAVDDEERRKRRRPLIPAFREDATEGQAEKAAEVLGRDDVTVRFVFGAALDQ